MKKIKEYFNLSNREFNATKFLILFLLLLMIARFTLPYVQFNSTVDFSKFNSEINEFEKSAYTTKNENDFDYLTEYSKDYAKSRQKEIEPFNFNPNTTDSLGFLLLGFSPKQAKVICNFKRKGGKFYNKESFQKMYCVSPKMYKQLEPFIIIDLPNKINYKDELSAKTDTSKFNKQASFIKKKENIIIEINDADSILLKKIEGIGSTFAKRIIAYRERLGGYIYKKQLTEVIGVDTAIYNILDKHIVVDSSIIKKIDINNVTFYSLKNFPYLTKNQVIALINYRDNHGKFAKVADIKKCILIDENTFSRIKPYIKIYE
jgi:DNA uptake protein ComE-like DNA-binding protein